MALLTFQKGGTLEMLKKHLVTVVVSIALIVAIVTASIGVANGLVAREAVTGQAIACNSSGHSGGGC